jgi:hypothetical protein
MQKTMLQPVMTMKMMGLTMNSMHELTVTAVTMTAAAVAANGSSGLRRKSQSKMQNVRSKPQLIPKLVGLPLQSIPRMQLFPQQQLPQQQQQRQRQLEAVLLQQRQVMTIRAPL